jgi:hypothetical protein
MNVASDKERDFVNIRSERLEEKKARIAEKKIEFTIEEQKLEQKKSVLEKKKAEIKKEEAKVVKEEYEVKKKLAGRRQNGRTEDEDKFAVSWSIVEQEIPNS